MPHIDIRCKKWEHDKHGAPALLLWNACHVETYIKMEIQDRWSVMELVIGEVASNMALAIHAGSMGLAWRPIQFRFFLKTLEEGKSRRSGCWTAPAPGKTYLWIPLSLQWSIEWCWIALKSCPNSIIPLPILLAAGASRKQNHQMHPNVPNIQGQTEKPLVNQGKEAQFGSFGHFDSEHLWTGKQVWSCAFMFTPSFYILHHSDSYPAWPKGHELLPLHSRGTPSNVSKTT